MVLNFNQIRVTLLVIVVLVPALCVANQCRANDKQTSCEHSVDTTSMDAAIEEYINSGYFILDRLDMTFNEHVRYLLVVMERTGNINESRHSNLPIVLLRMVDDKFVKEGVMHSFANENTSAQGFICVKFNKDHSCFILSDSFYADNCFIASSLTFKYSSDKNKIVLDNLKLDYLNRENPDESISSKDIHLEEQIILGDITEQRLIQLITPNNLSAEYDNQITCTDTAQIDGRRFIGISTEKDGFYIIDDHNRRVFSYRSLECTWFAFEDFDNDGYLDIKCRYVGNIPVEELLLFDKKCGNFRKVEGFIDYPKCTNILDTKYYYSYHRSGCADYNWDSDLFYIENYRTIHLGNISGIGCVDSGVELGVFINKIKGQCKTIIKKLPIEIIEEYENSKWGFIEDYWKKNYRLFDDGIN